MVWIVAEGVDYEGECIVAAFSTEEKARAYVEAWDGSKWVDYLEVTQATIDGPGGTSDPKIWTTYNREWCES